MLTYQKGKLVSWNDKRGFGFIEPETQTKNVFLHISVLKKSGRRPQKGDTVYYQLDFDERKRLRAYHAYIEGVSYQHKTNNRTPTKRRQPGNSFTHRKKKSVSQIVVIVILILIGGMIGERLININRQKKRTRIENTTPSPSIAPRSSPYRCEGKTWCSEMVSCEEAKFYLRNCPNVSIDGDGDGIPCESQWCGN